MCCASLNLHGLYRTGSASRPLSGRLLGVCLQVVYSGPLDSAAPYFKEVGFVPDELRSNIADYMLDLVIRATDADVAGMVDRFAG